MTTITLSPLAIEQLEALRLSDSKLLIKTIALITEIAKNPFSGTGKPEPLKHELSGKWSRRINLEHRLVYEVKDNSVLIISCQFHYF